MYLYHSLTEENEVYFCGTAARGRTVVRSTYRGRVHTEGAALNHNFTVTNLTVNDSGVYTCVYKESVDKTVKCTVYTVFVRGVCTCFCLVKNSVEELNTSV